MREDDLPRDVVMNDVRRYAREIVPAFNAYLYFRVGTWLARRLSTLLYRVRVGVRNGAEGASLSDIDPNATVVFVMNHRSNMDYVLVAYLAATSTALSYAVGEWARIWPLQTLIRSLGAYFIRRNSKNPLYRKVLERYVAMATAAGVTQAVYPEGGLSRDGRIRPPRLGLLSYMVKGFDPNGDRDLVFIPVGLNYDRVLEDRSLLLDRTDEPERQGTWPAVRTTLRFIGHQLFLMLRGRWYRFGYACVNFGPPVSMRRYVTGTDANPMTMPDEQYRQFVEELGAYLLQRVGEVVPILPVSLVSTVLLDESDGLNEFDIKARAHTLLGVLEGRGARLYIPRSDWEYAVTVGLRMLTLRKAVTLEDGLYVVDRKDTRLLRYYANAIQHLLDDGEPDPVHVVAEAAQSSEPAFRHSLAREHVKSGDE
jgi:glycerol-3-phosphate O-acyltransferase